MTTSLALPVHTTRIPGPADGPLLLKSDGVHWAGSFGRLVHTLISDLIAEAPFTAQFTFDGGESADALATYSAQIVRYNGSNRTATTADGVHILIDDLVAFAV